jgi:uncharacterized membrane protein (DUF373 family)
MAQVLEIISYLIAFFAIAVLIPIGFLWTLNVMFHCRYPYDVEHILATLFILILLFGITK